MNTTLLAFARSPVPGRAKTRLIPALGEQGAAALHAALVRDTIERVVAADIGPVELWAGDADEDGFLQALASIHAIPLHAQFGADLGERMAAALVRATAGGQPAIVVGSDAPTLAVADIRAAAGALAHHDAVLTPALDGGYVLLGLHSVDELLFRDLPWGSERVLAETRARLKRLGWRWQEMAPRPDVDRPEDLAHVAALGGKWTRFG